MTSRKKRVAESQLTKGEYERNEAEEHEELDEADDDNGLDESVLDGFQKASEEEISQRRFEYVIICLYQAIIEN